jgi:hypothetical protein
MTMPGPCVICGATNYALSMGGPSLCPACDCGHFNGHALAVHNAKLSAQLQAAEARAEALQSAWDWLASYRRLSIEWDGPVYCDDDGPDEGWRVYRESGNVNDREWEEIGFGSTPLEAVQAASQALSTLSGGEK